MISSHGQPSRSTTRGVGLGCGIAIAVGVLVLVSTGRHARLLPLWPNQGRRRARRRHRRPLGPARIGATLHVAMRPLVHHADVYACEAGELTRPCSSRFTRPDNSCQRFFFTSCKLQPQRAGKPSEAMSAAAGGSWHSQGATDVLDQTTPRSRSAR